jgi:DNA polymerase III sliding clamp (beta) subunit (PCNA family)
MRFEINRMQFLAALTRAAMVSKLDAATPRLACVVIRVDEGATRAWVGCGSGGASIASSVQCIGDIAPGIVQVDARLMAAAVESFVGHDTLWVKSWGIMQVHISAGSAEMMLHGMEIGDGERCVSVERPALTPIDGAALLRCIRTVEHAASRDSARGAIYGISVHRSSVEGRLQLTATDGRRLATVSSPDIMDADAIPGGFPGAFVIATPMVPVVRRLLADKSIGGGGWMMRGDALKLYLKTQDGSVQFACDLPNVAFPDYTVVVTAAETAADREHPVVVKARDFLAALRRCGIMDESRTHNGAVVVSHEPGHSLSISMKTPRGSFSGYVDSYTRAGETPLSFIASRKYLRDAVVAAGSGEVTMGTGGGLSPVIITSNTIDAQFIVMPMRSTP